MFYPAYVHREKKSAYGLTFPDFEGCFAAADTLEGLPQAAQEAVQVHFMGESFAIPDPSSPERWVKDKRFTGGYWMLVDIDLSRISTKAVRLNISLPEQLVHQIDEFAQSHNMTRSAFLASAAKGKMGLGA
ncbi:MAG: type II toxin-antitoxin system HicB family antitoxin [Pseudomonadota bacterium]